ncbi:Ig-like domain-containing protein [Belliella sp. R4-6]|uniref:Ig-like domain-containing protein n=1 Tax=Belliella alkalica TaxID=1730871 RepID=A0ABS9VGP4_9BACT|nr:glucoamylase family protein [Belliella alkalica]MCH7415588.1 Ig-like domain-containing protein [Belliella alkalica]
MNISKFYLPLFILLLFSCKENKELPNIILTDFLIDNSTPIVNSLVYQDIPLDKPLVFRFSGAIDAASTQNNIKLSVMGQSAFEDVNFSLSLVSNNREIIIYPDGLLQQNSIYRIEFVGLKGTNGELVSHTEITFQTIKSGVEIESIDLFGSKRTSSGKYIDAYTSSIIVARFSSVIDKNQNFENIFKIEGNSSVKLEVESINEVFVFLKPTTPLDYFAKYQFIIEPGLKSEDGDLKERVVIDFYTRASEEDVFPRLPIDDLLTKVQEQTFRYFWDFAHPNSGMARERNTSGNLVTVGGSGFGVMAILVGIERGFISRQQGIERISKIVNFLDNADRFHGAWSHWIDGNTGRALPFSEFDNGGDLVETALMIQGLLTARQYLDDSNPLEKAIQEKITKIWEEVEWSWYTRGNQDVLYWHWSPEHQWAMDLRISGYNESLITYVLAAASPTYPISKRVYDSGWARNGSMRNGNRFYNVELPLGEDFGGPMFFSHYSFLGLDPRNLSDQYADYWKQSKHHTYINRMYSITNPLDYAGYNENSWGLTASDNHEGYSAHSPLNDRGVITPTAALSSMPYLPTESIKALEFFYYKVGNKLWGDYGFYDAFNLTENWFADSYLAIDQGPIILMIENYRTALLWDLFMKDEEVKAGLDKLNFSY